MYGITCSKSELGKLFAKMEKDDTGKAVLVRDFLENEDKFWKLGKGA